MRHRTPRAAPVAEVVDPIVRGFLGGAPDTVALRWWDGSVSGAIDAATSIHFRDPLALRRLLYAPNELGFARAYVTGEIEIEGSIFDALELREAIGRLREHVTLALPRSTRLELVRAARRLGIWGLPLRPPPEEVRLRGRLHSKGRDAAAVGHHYDVSNDFYRLVLGSSMTYSCAYFARDDMTLEKAQAAKYDLVCRKLGLGPGMRLLDVGCGWGGLVMHAARHYGVTAVGITISKAQSELAEKRVVETGLRHAIEIRRQDYRDVTDGPFDAISSIGMFEHVGVKRLGEYFGSLHDLLRPQGRLLNHAISRPSGSAKLNSDSFVARYVFPDGELQEVGSVITAMQAHSLEVRDVESLREHYARTLRAWVANLEDNWDAAVRSAGPNRARVWRLYMAGSALGFEGARINVHQVLGIKPDASGTSGMPATRASFVDGPLS